MMADHGCRSDIMFDDKPDNQPIHYKDSGLPNDVGLDPWCFLLFQKLRWKQNKWGVQQAQQTVHNCMITDIVLSNH
jgi:hypothetical protein